MIKIKERKSPYPNPHDYGKWRACPGVPIKEEFVNLGKDEEKDKNRYTNRRFYCSLTDMAWIICLLKAKILDKETCKIILNGLKKLVDSEERGFGGEVDLIPILENNEDIASLINLGRTMQEPMSRLQMRDQLIDFFDYFIKLMESILKFAEKNIETIMPGHTHFSQANPITLANYMLSLFDNMHRGLMQLELSYKLVNKNSGGCGATSGTVWPIDRLYMTKLLGFDELLEVTYDCEASQDHTLSVMFALANITATLSKFTMDIEIWGMEEIDMICVDRCLAGVSSMMPQKCHNGIVESMRCNICNMLGNMITGVLYTKGEPHGDVMAMFGLPTHGIFAIAQSKTIIRFCDIVIQNLHPQKENMLKHVTKGYSCMTELVVYLIKELGYGPRRAHRICAHLTRLARDRHIPASQITSEMLDEAANMCEEIPPHIDTKTIKKCLDPVEFIKTHNNLGGPAPSESKRMIKRRKEIIIRAKQRQQKRKQRVEKALQDLYAEVEKIRSSSTKTGNLSDFSSAKNSRNIGSDLS